MTQNPGTTPPGDGGQTPPQGDPPGQTPPPQSQTQSGQPPTTQQQQKTPLDALPPDVQEYIRLLRDEAKTNREKLEAETRAKQQAEEERMKKRGEYEDLAKKHEARVKELEPLAKRLETLSALLKGQMDAQVKDWPEHIKFSDPGPDADVEVRMAWMEKARPHVETSAAQQRGQAPGNSPNPPSAGGDISQRDIEEHIRRGRESGRHRIL